MRHLSLVPQPEDVLDDPAFEANVVRLVVFGKPEPGGSKKAVSIPGRKFSQVIDANPRADGWKKTVAKVAMVEMVGRDMLEGALGVRMEFALERPASVKRERPTVKPDVLKLSRPVEDALTGIVWIDDAQITYEVLTKRYALADEKPHVSLAVWRLL